MKRKRSNATVSDVGKGDGMELGDGTGKADKDKDKRHEHGGTSKVIKEREQEETKVLN